MSRRFFLPFSQIQPSQLYVSRPKLAYVEAQWSPACLTTLRPITVVLLDGHVIATDGHTRASAVYRAGFEAVPVVWDSDDLDWDAYRICVAWCRALGITTIPDLAGRLLSATAYDDLWVGLCNRMHAALAAASCRTPRCLRKIAQRTLPG